MRIEVTGEGHHVRSKGAEVGDFLALLMALQSAAHIVFAIERLHTIRPAISNGEVTAAITAKGAATILEVPRLVGGVVVQARLILDEDRDLLINTPRREGEL